MEKKKNLVVLVGPTAVGKTDISVEIAKNLYGEIISADSMQIYKYMDIGTAKITEEEKKGIIHYLIDVVYPNEEFSVSDFQKKASILIEEISNRGRLPMIIGGTGLYINSLVYNLDFTNAVSNEMFREKYLDKANRFGNENIHNELKKIDPESSKRIHVNDTKRIIRALEIYYETGKPMSFYYNKFREPNDSYNLAFIGLKMDRKKLYDRINKRVDLMIEYGLVEEVERLLKIGYNKNLSSLQGLGYKEIIKYIDGEYSLDEAIEIIKRDTRRFAKRQLTWFRRDNRIMWIDIDEFNNKKEGANHLIEYLTEKFNF